MHDMLVWTNLYAVYEYVNNNSLQSSMRWVAKTPKKCTDWVLLLQSRATRPWWTRGRVERRRSASGALEERDWQTTGPNPTEGKIRFEWSAMWTNSKWAHLLNACTIKNDTTVMNWRAIGAPAKLKRSARKARSLGQAVGSNPTEGKIHFSQFTPFVNWNVKNCFAKLI